MKNYKHHNLKWHFRIIFCLIEVCLRGNFRTGGFMAILLAEVIAAQKGATICGMHLYAASSSKIPESWCCRVNPTRSFMTVSHVSDEGQRSFVHTQLSQLQSFQYLGKAVTIRNTRRDCHGQSPNYLLWTYFYPPSLILGPYSTERQRQSSVLLMDSNTSAAVSSMAQWHLLGAPQTTLLSPKATGTGAPLEGH